MKSSDAVPTRCDMGSVNFELITSPKRKGVSVIALRTASKNTGTRASEPREPGVDTSAAVLRAMPCRSATTLNTSSASTTLTTPAGVKPPASPSGQKRAMMTVALTAYRMTPAIVRGIRVTTRRYKSHRIEQYSTTCGTNRSVGD